MKAPSKPRPSRDLVALLGPVKLTESAAAALVNPRPSHRRYATPRQLARTGSQAPSTIVLCAEELSRREAREVLYLREHLPESPVIALAPRVERWGLRAVLGAGAAGVVIADEELAARLNVCVQAARSGQVCVPLTLQRHIAPPALSTREKQILGLVVMGYMNCQIAEQLFLAESTVKSHLSSAFGKLGVRSRNEAARLILDPEQGLGMGILALSGQVPAATPVAPDGSAAALTLA